MGDAITFSMQSVFLTCKEILIYLKRIQICIQLKIIITMMLNTKLKTLISLDYDKLEESRLGTFACSSLPIKKVLKKN